jgi:FtsH-binding integral membrane protein
MPFSSSPSRPAVITISRFGQAHVYALVALALALTAFGVFIGAAFAGFILSSGYLLFILILELILVVTARAWSRSFPLNYLLFAVFPILSGISVTPLIISIVAGYINGPAILLNATLSTMFLTAAAAVLALTSSTDFGGLIGRFLFQALIGLIFFGVLQLIFPALRGSGIDMIVSGVGIVVFSLFLVVDMQRVQQGSAYGDSPFMMALSLYLDIFNLFLYVLRFMSAMSGRRR